MSNEIQASGSLSLTQGSQLANWSTGPVSINQLGNRSTAGVQTVGTSPSLLGAIPNGTLGYVLIQNISTTTGNPVYLAHTSGGTRFAQLDAVEFALFKLGPDAQNCCASVSSGTALINVLILEF